MRFYKYSKKGIEVTDAIRDNESIAVIMPNKKEIHTDFPIPYGQIRKAILFIDQKYNYKLEVY